MSNHRNWTAGLVLAIMVLPSLGAATVVVAPALVLGPATAILHSGPAHPTTKSQNWAGYAVSSTSGTVSFVRGSWIEPKAVSCPASGYQYSSFWVGIDGFGTSTVEQTGTDTDCWAGVAHYYAWYEFYPHPSFTISTVPIHPGDTISASAKWVNSTVGFKVNLTDVTTGKYSWHTSKVSGASRATAEWIAEAPSSGGILPLADFGKVHFGKDATAVASTNVATISGTTGDLTSFGSSLYKINMIDHAGTAYKALTSAVSHDGTSFNVTWKRAGP